MEQLFTVWGEKLDRDNVLGEYPRPSLRREGWVCLNGLWDYVFTKRGKRPVKDASGNICWDGKILVPFSPEAALSGVGRQLMPDETLWYRRELPAGRAEAGTRILMNFGAVDTACRLLINRPRGGPPHGRLLAVLGGYHRLFEGQRQRGGA